MAVRAIGQERELKVDEGTVYLYVRRRAEWRNRLLGSIVCGATGNRQLDAFLGRGERQFQMSRQSVLSSLPSRRSSHFTVQVRPSPDPVSSSRPGEGGRGPGISSVQPDPPGTFGVSPQCWTPPRLQSPSIAWRAATLNHDWTMGGGSTTASRHPHPTTAPVSKHPGHGQPAEPGTERNGSSLTGLPHCSSAAPPPARPGLASGRRSSPPRTPRPRPLKPWWRCCAIRRHAPPQNEAEVLDPHPPPSLSGRSRFRVVDLPSRDHEEAHPPCRLQGGAPSFEVSYPSGESVRKYAGTSTWLSMPSSGWAISPPRSCYHTSS